MEQYGLITENKGETAIVTMQKHLSCEKCGRCGILSGAGKRDVSIEVFNPIKAEKGQRVILETDDRRMLFVSFMLYMVPLFGLLAGIFLWLRLADYFIIQGNQELYAVGTGFGFMVIIFFFIRVWDNKAKNNPNYKPVITEILDEPGSEAECEDPQ